MSRLTLEQASLGFVRRGRRQPILQRLDLAVEKGASLVVLGPSGCGKSSLLNVLAGFQSLDEGRVQLDGRTLAGPGGERGVVFQDDALMPWLNALDNVALGLELPRSPLLGRLLGTAQRQARAQAAAMSRVSVAPTLGSRRV